MEQWVKKHKKEFQKRDALRKGAMKLCDDISGCDGLQDVRRLLKRIIKVWRLEDVCFGTFKTELASKWLDMLNHVSASPCMMITMTRKRDVTLSKEVLELFREVLGPDLEIEFAMDCSRDEEIAMALAAAEEDMMPFPMPNNI